MREADRRTIDDIGIPSIVLMENAGRQAVAAMEAAFVSRPAMWAFCAAEGTTAVTALSSRALVQRGIEATVFLLGSVSEVRGDARTNLEVLGRLGITVVEVTNAQEWELHFSEISECDVLVDAILGTGFSGPLNGFLETVVADVNDLGVPVVAIDVPTGLSADSTRLDGDAIEASMTVTLAAPKIPLVLPPADTHAGDLVIADIGIPAPVLDDVEGRTRAAHARTDAGTRPASGRGIAKRGFRPILIIAGSMGKTMPHTSRHSARCGRALPSSQVATARSCLPILASMGAEYMTEPLDETPTGTIDYAAVDRVLEIKADIIAVGPGLGSDPRRRRRAGRPGRALGRSPGARRGCAWRVHRGAGAPGRPRRRRRHLLRRPTPARWPACATPPWKPSRRIGSTSHATSPPPTSSTSSSRGIARSSQGLRIARS